MLGYWNLARRHGERAAAADVNMTGGVTRFLVAWRLILAERAIRPAASLDSFMVMRSALQPKDVRDRMVIAVRCVSQIAVEATAHRNHRHQKSGQAEADRELHAGREPQGTSEVKLSKAAAWSEPPKRPRSALDLHLLRAP